MSCQEGPVRTPKFTRHADMADLVRAADGRWVVVCTRTYRDSARKFVRDIQEGRDLNYQPACDYEAEYRTGEKNIEVWVRKAA
jgi:hypothetical protein